MDFPDFSDGPHREGAPLPPETVRAFRRFVRDYYAREGRSLPWRETRDPYEILVSEFMLQQTQTERVAARYPAFLSAFPSFEVLARAELPEVFALWRGLGYNRRAKALRDTAIRVVWDHGGSLPADPSLLESFPGIGPYTARAVCAFAFDLPVVFVETNIRRVYLHCYFRDAEGVRDRELLSLVEATLDEHDPRHWYYALMDLGVALRSALPNPNRRSAHYARQSPFKNSDRQIRGRILHLLSDRGSLDEGELFSELSFPEERVAKAVARLEEEGLLLCEKGIYRIGR